MNKNKLLTNLKNEYIGRTYAYICGLLIVVLTFSIMFFIFSKGMNTFIHDGVSIKEFLFSSVWQPDGEPARFGALIFIAGSTFVSLGAVIISAPVSIALAIFMHYISPKLGDRVLISCISACGKCVYCRKNMYSHCTTGGWILGNTIDGTQAEFVRIPYADTSLYRIPEGADEEALVMLSDILPTGFECGVLNGKVQPGSTIAIIGAGPVGLAALLTAQFYSPAEIIVIDLGR